MCVWGSCAGMAKTGKAPKAETGQPACMRGGTGRSQGDRRSRRAAWHGLRAAEARREGRPGARYDKKRGAHHAGLARGRRGGRQAIRKRAQQSPGTGRPRGPYPRYGGTWRKRRRREGKLGTTYRVRPMPDTAHGAAPGGPCQGPEAPRPGGAGRLKKSPAGDGGARGGVRDPGRGGAAHGARTRPGEGPIPAGEARHNRRRARRGRRPSHYIMRHRGRRRTSSGAAAPATGRAPRLPGNVHGKPGRCPALTDGAGCPLLTPPRADGFGPLA